MEWIVIVSLAAILFLFLRARSEAAARRRLEESLRELTIRVYQLEHAEAAAFVATTPEPVSESAPLLEQPPIPLPTRPTLGMRIRRHVGDDEWEALVGGSLLNKLGALILVVGLVLFLGYSFTQMGPAGRVAVSLGVGAALLASGALVERKQRYRVFAWGLMGAGWASLYATSYAMYAMEAARVIENPTLGAGLQMAVAAAMVVHSLRYRQQTVTGIAAASAFAALAVVPSQQFGAASLLPLSSAMLYLAHRLRWHAVGLFSLIASYGIVIARGDQHLPLFSTQAFLLTLWLIFEAFDVIRLRDPEPAPAYAAALYPLNALGFLGLSAWKWEAVAPEQLFQFLAAAGLLYLCDAILRGMLRKDAYRASIVLASGLAALSIVRQAGGAWAAAMLAVEAEVLLLAALQWRLRFLEWLAGAVFAGALIRLGVAATGPDSLVVAGMTLHQWTPAAALIAILAYVNRVYRTVPVPYGYFGSAVVQLILGAETPSRWLGLAWFAWAAIVLELGLWRKAVDFLRQSYVAWAFGCVTLIVTHLMTLTRTPPLASWVSVAGAGVLGFYGCWRLWSAARSCVASTISAVAATVFALVLSGKVLAEAYVPMGWMALALLWMECAYRWAHRPLRWLGHSVAALVLLPLALLRPFTTLAVLPVAGGYAYLWRRCRAESWTRVYCWMATLLVALLLHFELDQAQTAVAWAALGLGLFVVGLRTGIADLRWQSYVLAFAVTIGCIAWVYDPAGRAVASAIVTVILYGQEFLAPREWAERSWERFARPGFSALATVLLSVLLYREISGSVLTVAWGVQGLLLLTAGFPMRERVLRISGLLMLLVCILKLFFYDLRNLDTLPRIFSFMILGVILIGVSWAYTRFRERLRRLL